METVLERENVDLYEVKKEEVASLKDTLDSGEKPLSVREMVLYTYAVMDSAETHIYHKLQEPASVDVSFHKKELKEKLSEILNIGESLNENYAIPELARSVVYEGGFKSRDESYLTLTAKILNERIERLEESEFPEEFVETRRKHAEVLRKTIEDVKQRTKNI